MKIGGNNNYFDQVGLEVLESPNRPGQYLLKRDPFFVLSWFDSPLGIKLLDIRRVIILGVDKNPALLALLDSFVPPTVGQWIFACDPGGLCSLTFGLQLPEVALNKQVLEASITHVASFVDTGKSILEEISRDPDSFPGSMGAKVVHVVSQDDARTTLECAEDRWPLMMDKAYEALDAGNRYHAKQQFEALVEEGWVGATLALLDEFEGDYTADEALIMAHQGATLAFPQFELIGMNLKYRIIPRVMFNRLQAKHQGFGSDDNPTEIMEIAKELGAYLESSRPEIMVMWDDANATELAVTFAKICVSFFSAWDLAGMPLRHHGRLLQALDFVFSNTDHIETRDWAREQIIQTINSWGERIPATVLLDSVALTVFEKFRGLVS